MCFFPYMENVNVAYLNLQKTKKFKCIYLKTNFWGFVQLCIKASTYKSLFSPSSNSKVFSVTSLRFT